MKPSNMPAESWRSFVIRPNGDSVPSHQASSSTSTTSSTNTSSTSTTSTSHHSSKSSSSSNYRSHLITDEDRRYSVNFPIFPVPKDIDIAEPQRSLIPKHSDIATKKYATSVDERNFLTVYEYLVNNQWVIWDYYTGYVHLTGLWKAIGNSKADIVKLIDNSPDLEPVIRRVRGGFLKIQGTWLPFEIARTLASRTCYFIRFALIPIFGPTFPESCLQPHEPGFGQLQLNLTNPTKKRRKRSSLGGSGGVGGASGAAGPNLQSDAKRRKSEASKEFPRQKPAHRATKSIEGGTIYFTSNFDNNRNDHDNSSLHGRRSTFSTAGTSSQVPQVEQDAFSVLARKFGQVTNYDYQSAAQQTPANSQHIRSYSANGIVGDSRKPDYQTFMSGEWANVIESSSSVSSSDNEDSVNFSKLVSPSRSRNRATSFNYAGPGSYSVFKLKPNKLAPEPTTPPPMPVKIAFADEKHLVDSPDEFLQVLQATRSLQQISAGHAGRRWSFDDNKLGGGFECGGKLWRWDGRQELNVVGLSPPAVIAISPPPPSVSLSLPKPPVAQVSEESLKTPRFLPRSGLDEIPDTSLEVDNRAIVSNDRNVMDINGLLT